MNFERNSPYISKHIIFALNEVVNNLSLSEVQKQKAIMVLQRDAYSVVPDNSVYFYELKTIKVIVNKDMN